jgi:hypothetical protein
MSATPSTQQRRRNRDLHRHHLLLLTHLPITGNVQTGASTAGQSGSGQQLLQAERFVFDLSVLLAYGGEEILIWLCKVMLYLTQFELAIARSTGRRQESIAALIADEQKWEKALWDCRNPLILD